MTFIATAIAVLSTAASIQGQRVAAKAQERQQKIAAQLERQRYLEEVTSIRQQQAQEQVALSQRMQNADVQAMEAKSKAVVAAGEGGVSGLSVEALIANISRKEATYAFSERKQAEMVDTSRTIGLQSAGAGYQRNLFTINKPIPQPDYVGAALSGAQTGLTTRGALVDSGLTIPKQSTPVKY
jgi:hypothetical protein